LAGVQLLEPGLHTAPTTIGVGIKARILVDLQDLQALDIRDRTAVDLQDLQALDIRDRTTVDLQDQAGTDQIPMVLLGVGHPFNVAVDSEGQVVRDLHLVGLKVEAIPLPCRIWLL
jgi:hypothetical protein